MIPYTEIAARPQHRAAPLHRARKPSTSPIGYSRTFAATILAVVVLVSEAWAVGGVAMIALKPAIVTSAVVVLSVLVSPNTHLSDLLRKSPVLAGSSMIFALAVVGIPFAGWPGAAFKFVTSNLLVFVAFALAISSIGKSPRDYSGLLKWHTVTFLAVGILNLALTATHRNIEGRLRGLGLYDPNELAALAALTVPLALGLVFLRTGWLWRAIGIASIPVAGLIVLESGSRGGILALATGIAVTLAGLKIRRSSSVVLALLLAGAGVVTRADFNAVERVKSLTAIEEDYNMSARTGRIEIWKRGLSYMISRPLNGVGIAGFSAAEGRRSAEESVSGAWLNAHNILVQIGAELGLPGLIVMIWMMLKSLRIAGNVWSPFGRDPAKNRPEVLGALASFLMAGMFLSLAYSTLLVFAMGVAFVGAQRPLVGPARSARMAS